jgi:hypothetical protein
VAEKTKFFLNLTTFQHSEKGLIKWWLLDKWKDDVIRILRVRVMVKVVYGFFGMFTSLLEL